MRPSGSHRINLKVIVEKHNDGYLAYPLGLKGVVVAEGDSFEEALAGVRSAVQSHVDTFGAVTLDQPTAREVFVAEIQVETGPHGI